MPDPIVVYGRSRLIVDIIRGVLADDELPRDGRAVAVLVDPEPEHWASVGDRAVVLVTSAADHDAAIAAIRRGADAVVEADRVIEDLARAVVAVRAGGAALSPKLLRQLMDTIRTGIPDDRPHLTRREAQIVASILVGDSVKQTARRLGITPKTVENLQSRLFRKLDVRNRAQAVARVHELDLVDEVDAPKAVGGPSLVSGGQPF